MYIYEWCCMLLEESSGFNLDVFSKRSRVDVYRRLSNWSPEYSSSSLNCMVHCCTHYGRHDDIIRGPPSLGQKIQEIVWQCSFLSFAATLQWWHRCKFTTLSSRSFSSGTPKLHVRHVLFAVFEAKPLHMWRYYLRGGFTAISSYPESDCESY